MLEKIKPLHAKKDSLSNDYKVITKSIATTESSVSEKSGGAANQQDAVKQYKTLVEAANKKVDVLIAAITERAPEKKATVITSIKTAIGALKQEDLNSNLIKIKSS